KLAAGQSLMADLSQPAGANIQMKALDAKGNAVANQVSLTDNGLPALAFTAAQAGDYFVQLSNAPGTSSGLYVLTLEATGLANSQYDSGAMPRWWLQYGDGHMYASLTGNVLNITGATGYGFGLQGNWN